jgi:hypothetical protein
MEGGYRFIRVNRPKIAVHRYVMEVKLERALCSDEIVHHVDWNRLNNDPDNLGVPQPIRASAPSRLLRPEAVDGRGESASP